jgi:hypothetical protein
LRRSEKKVSKHFYDLFFVTFSLFFRMNFFIRFVRTAGFGVRYGEGWGGCRQGG